MHFLSRLHNKIKPQLHHVFVVPWFPLLHQNSSLHFPHLFTKLTVTNISTQNHQNSKINYTSQFCPPLLPRPIKESRVHPVKLYLPERNRNPFRMTPKNKNASLNRFWPILRGCFLKEFFLKTLTPHLHTGLTSVRKSLNKKDNKQTWSSFTQRFLGFFWNGCCQADGDLGIFVCWNCGKIVDGGTSWGMTGLWEVGNFGGWKVRGADGGFATLHGTRVALVYGCTWMGWNWGKINTESARIWKLEY